MIIQKLKRSIGNYKPFLLKFTIIHLTNQIELFIISKRELINIKGQMKFSTRFKKLGYNVSEAKSYEVHDDWETCLFDDYRLACHIEDGYIVISILNFKKRRDWIEISRSKNYSKQYLK
jgi:hypothetical protein